MKSEQIAFKEVNCAFCGGKGEDPFEVMSSLCIFFIERHKGTQYGFYQIPAYRKPGQVFALHAIG